METTQVTNFRREVLRRIAKYTWNDCLPEHIYDILYEVVTDSTPRVRCCVHKERAVLKNRIQMALWQPLGLNIINASKEALNGSFDKRLPVVDVLPNACDACPIEKYYVTDVCRHCISHKCMNNCPKHAISIQNNRAFINRDVCIECGRCAKSCPYGAIIEISRPCMRACALDAISAGPDRRTVIDYNKCVHCGNCRTACPFGAIDERSMIMPLLVALKQKKKVIAMLAPSFVGQFGMKVTFSQLVAGLKKTGFAKVAEVAVGADITTLHEAEEFLEKVPKSIDFMTSSCCPAFVDLVKKHFPNYEDNISKTTSPMVSCARYLKNKYPDAMTCFIGPCIAKKAECVANPDCMDFVLTFEELQCLFEGIGIDLNEPAPEEVKSEAAAGGIGFPLLRGVQASMKEVLPEDVQQNAKLEYAAGLRNCHEKLQQLKDGKLEADYLEGMACANGCVDGPGALAMQGLTRVLVAKFAAATGKKTSLENPEAVEAVKEINFEV
ncbi:MAG: 4Fe-4S binding protein [Acidaminococcaceae bacterium]|nr:4Fe-4S binding protein [Acidaminococcaceae bacterium]